MDLATYKKRFNQKKRKEITSSRFLINNNQNKKICLKFPSYIIFIRIIIYIHKVLVK